MLAVERRSWYQLGIGIKVVLSRWRLWRQEQLECLRRRATAELVRSPDGRYEEEQGSGGVTCFSLIGSPVYLMLLVHILFSFRSSLWFMFRV